MTALAHWSRRATPRGALSLSDEWRTPAWLFEYCSRRYGPLTLDAAAVKWNYQCPLWLSKAEDALTQRWGMRTWCNPPYSRDQKKRFTRWGREQVLAGDIALVCFLLPHDTADGYWREQIEAPAGRCLRVSKEWNDVGTIIRTEFRELTVEKTELHRRMRYHHDDGSRSCRPGTARHSSALVVFARPGLLRPLVRALGQEAIR